MEGMGIGLENNKTGKLDWLVNFAKMTLRIMEC